LNARTITSILFASGLATAQAQVIVDSGGFACGLDGPAALDNGAAAAAVVQFDYSQAEARLDVTVTNTSPIQPDVPSPLITHVYFNVPAGTVSTATLLTQTAAGETQPAFVFGFDPDAGNGDDPNQAACLGTFNFRLAAADVSEGIANDLAEVFCFDPKQPLLRGPVTFRFHLEGPDVHNLTSDVFAASTSRNTSKPVNVAVGFGGANCTGTGTLGNGDVCRTAVFVRGAPQLGQTVQLSVIGGERCRAFLGLSDSAGPAGLKKFDLPIGLPVLFTFDFGYLPLVTPEAGLPVFIPFAPELVGFTVYMTSLTHPYLQDLVGPWTFAPAYALTVVGPFDPPL
jgi:hypothetical protein